MPEHAASPDDFEKRLTDQVARAKDLASGATCFAANEEAPIQLGETTEETETISAASITAIEDSFEVQELRQAALVRETPMLIENEEEPTQVHQTTDEIIIQTTNETMAAAEFPRQMEAYINVVLNRGRLLSCLESVRVLRWQVNDDIEEMRKLGETGKAAEKALEKLQEPLPDLICSLIKLEQQLAEDIKVMAFSALA